MQRIALPLLLAAGCTDAGTSFRVTGRVASDAPVTHIVATAPLGGGNVRIAAPVDSDGAFDLELTPDHPWHLAFADAKQSGSQMLRGSFQANSLDVLLPAQPGWLDLDRVTVQNGIAYSNIAYTSLLAQLGMDGETAARIGRADDLAARYANPDIDGDGILDALQPERDFRLDVTGSFQPRVAGRALMISDLVANTAPDAIHYAGTTVHASINGEAQPVANIASGMSGMARASFANNTTTDTYRVQVGGAMLTFTDVHLPSAGALAAGEDMLVPRIHLVPATDHCTGDCPVASVDVSWLRATPDGWVDAMPGELAAARPPSATAVVAAPDGTRQTVNLPFTSAIDASAPWQAGVWSGQICSLALAYDDQLGMRLTSEVVGTSTACASR